MSDRQISLRDLAGHLESKGFQCRVEGESDILINAVNTLEDAQSGQISFLANPKYRHLLQSTEASAVIIRDSDEAPAQLPVIRCADPYAAVTEAITHIHGFRRHPWWGIDDKADIDPSSTIGDHANIGPYAVIAANTTIGNSATIYPGCYIGKNVTVGDDVILYANVSIYDGSKLGNRVTLHSGTVIGEDGLAYAPVDGKWIKIPAIGQVVIDDDVEMGACCAINNATLGYTRIGTGTKFSDAIVIGHGTTVGKHCIFVAQTGSAGSATIGDHVRLAGRVAVSGHIRIGNHVKVGLNGSVWSDVDDGADLLGDPARDSREYRKQLVNLRRLPELRQKLRNLEAEVESLRRKLAGNL